MITSHVDDVTRRENESDQGTGSPAGVSASPGIERVSGLMQSEPGLWVSGVHVSFTDCGGAEVSVHHAAFQLVQAMTSLLGVASVPGKVCLLDVDGVPVIAASFAESADATDGGIEVVWFTDPVSAQQILGPAVSALLSPVKGAAGRLTC